MNKDYLVFSFLFFGGLTYLFYSASFFSLYPYFAVVTYMLIVSIGAYILFLKQMNITWITRIIVVNTCSIIALPIVEGSEWLGLSLLYLVLLTGLAIGYLQYQKE